MRKYVLIVEPDPDSRSAICESLADCGVPLQCPVDFASASALLGGGEARAAPCLVLLSVGPHDNAPAARLMDLLRKRTSSVGVPVIALTTIWGLKPFDEWTRVFTKPFDPNVLRQVVCAAAARCET